MQNYTNLYKAQHVISKKAMPVHIKHVGPASQPVRHGYIIQKHYEFYLMNNHH